MIYCVTQSCRVSIKTELLAAAEGCDLVAAKKKFFFRNWTIFKQNKQILLLTIKQSGMKHLLCAYRKNTTETEYKVLKKKSIIVLIIKIS